MIRPKILTGLFAFIVSVSVQAQSNETPPPALPVIPVKIFSVTDYGAVGDGKTMNTCLKRSACFGAFWGLSEVKRSGPARIRTLDQVIKSHLLYR